MIQCYNVLKTKGSGRMNSPMGTIQLGYLCRHKSPDFTPVLGGLRRQLKLVAIFVTVLQATVTKQIDFSQQWKWV